MVFVGAVLAAAVGSALAVFGPAFGQALVIRHGAEPILVLPVERGEMLGLRFVHSVDGLPVEDWYQVRAQGLVQVETRLLSFGTGMGQIPGQGRAVEEGAWLRVVEMDRPIGTLHLRVGAPAVDHTLLYRGREIHLSARWSGEALTLRVETARPRAGWRSDRGEPW